MKSLRKQLNTNNQQTTKGTTIVSIGGLFTILSLTIVQDDVWKIIVSGIGAALAITGGILMRVSKK